MFFVFDVDERGFLVIVSDFMDDDGWDYADGVDFTDGSGWIFADGGGWQWPRR